MPTDRRDPARRFEKKQGMPDCYFVRRSPYTLYQRKKARVYFTGTHIDMAETDDKRADRSVVIIANKQTIKRNTT
eukprot:scaffold16726_cov40-Attheya_sp.AAC.2